MCLPHHNKLSCVSTWQQYSEAPPTSQVILFSVYNSMVSEYEKRNYFLIRYKTIMSPLNMQSIALLYSA